MASILAVMCVERRHDRDKERRFGGGNAGMRISKVSWTSGTAFMLLWAARTGTMGTTMPTEPGLLSAGMSYSLVLADVRKSKPLIPTFVCM